MVDKKKVKKDKEIKDTLDEDIEKNPEKELSEKEVHEKDKENIEEKTKEEAKEDVDKKIEKNDEKKKKRYAKNAKVEKRKIPKSKIHFPNFKEVVKAMIMVFVITSIATVILFLFNLFSITVIQEVLKLILQ